MRNPRIPLASVAAAAALVVALAGCTDDSGNGSDDGDDAKASAKTTDVAAETTWPYQSTKGEAKVEVHELRVRGKLMQLTLTITAENPSAEGYDYENIYNLYGDISPSLVDASALKRYTVVADSDDSLLAPDPVNTDLYDGQPKDLSYTFAAPPKDVESLDLYVNEFPPVTDVPVVR